MEKGLSRPSRPVLIASMLGAAAAFAITRRLKRLSTLKYAPAVARRVDLTRYTGTWYEIAALPQRYERDAFGTVAHYRLSPEGGIEVENLTRSGGWEGEVKRIQGRAWVVDSETSAKLKVRFRWPRVSGDYWILDVGPSYDYALVGTPSRKALWILSREPLMNPTLYERLVERSRLLGFDVGRLRLTPQTVSDSESRSGGLSFGL